MLCSSALSTLPSSVYHCNPTTSGREDWSGDTARSLLPIKLPIREHPTTRCQRAKPPSYNLTSSDHFSIIREKGVKNQGQKQKTKEMKTRQVEQEACTICQHSYGDRKDQKSTEEWLSCAVCVQWFHESCAEGNGVIDDDGSLTCKDSLLPEM